MLTVPDTPLNNADQVGSFDFRRKNEKNSSRTD